MSSPSNPPAFVALTDVSTASHMNQLANQLLLLEQELIEDEYNQIDKQVVVGILEEMESIASNLMAVNAGESHSFLQEDLASFTGTLREARLAAASSPPRYYQAGKVAGGCTTCHQVSL